MDNIRELYEHLEQDNDFNYYYFMNHDIKSIYDNIEEMKDIIDVFRRYEKIIESETSYYIKGNYLYFTFNNDKYYHSPSDFDIEAKYIDSICKELEQLGCSNFYYNEGVLD